MIIATLKLLPGEWAREQKNGIAVVEAGDDGTMRFRIIQPGRELLQVVDRSLALGTWGRTPRGKRTAITDNDILGIFEPLSRHAQLTTKQIVAFDRRYESKTRNRLTDLYHEEGEWLERLSESIKFANPFSSTR